MRTLTGLLLCLLAESMLLAAPVEEKPEPPKPNIVVFFMDDLGYSDLAIDGAPDVETPNLDQLARDGVRLTHCYAAAPVCTPTRVAFMTGRYQHRLGLENVIAPSLGNDDQGLSADEPTLPRYLKSRGYATGLMGKWHLGSRPEFHPNRHGFDEFFGFLGGAVNYYSHLGEDGHHDLWENDERVELDGYLTDAIADRAVSFIERHADEPFFLDVAFNATHWPFHPPGLESAPEHPSGQPHEVIREWASNGTREDYVKMLESADEGIGRILATLEKLGLRDDTLVIFTSDNGGEWLSRMEPLFHRKRSLYEGGLRVPCILRWPARLQGSHVSAQPAITMDLAATILAAAGAEISSDRPLDGIDLLPLLSADATVDRTFFWRGVRASSEKAVRHGRWKWVSDSPLFPGMLFDVVTDPGERHDLAAKHTDVLREIAAKHAEWQKALTGATTAPGGAAPAER